jgi:cell division protease FtsH
MIVWLVIGLTILYFYLLPRVTRTQPEELSYSQFLEHLRAGQIVKLDISGEEGRGQFRIDNTIKEFTVTLPPTLPNNTLALLEEQGVQTSYKRPSRWMEILSWVAGPLIFVGLLWLLFYHQMRGAGRGAMSFGKSRARLAKDMVKVTFKDVAGVEEAKEELEEIIAFLKDPKKFQRLGGRIPKGVILIGPPGTGKTLLAKAVAGEANVPFFSISGSDFVEMFVGVGASRVRDMFEQGRKNAPCIIFLDEIDAVGRHRGAGLGGGHDEREQTLNQLLVEMDGFDTKEGVILIAATNRPDVLDPALLRPGRFDRQIVIDMPDIKGRQNILEVHAKKVVLDKAADLKRVARGTPGFSGADLANLVNEAALLAARRNKKSVTTEELEEARDKVRWGRERRSRVMDDEDKKVTAYHEAGHALVLNMIPETEPLHKVTIIPRGIAYLGATMQLPEKDRYHEFKRKILGQLAGLFGGRVAEEIIFGDITAGARSDIKLATTIARRMVCEWGMSEKMGPMTFGEREEHLFLGREVTRSIDYSEATAVEIDIEVKKIVDGCYQRAKDIVAQNRDKLVAIAEALLKYEVLDGKDVGKIIRTGKLRRPGGKRKKPVSGGKKRLKSTPEIKGKGMNPPDSGSGLPPGPTDRPPAESELQKT